MFSVIQDILKEKKKRSIKGNLICLNYKRGQFQFCCNYFTLKSYIHCKTHPQVVMLRRPARAPAHFRVFRLKPTHQAHV